MYKYINILKNYPFIDVLIDSLFWGSTVIRHISLTTILQLIDKTKVSIIHSDLMKAIHDNENTFDYLQEIIDEDEDEEIADLAQSILENFASPEDEQED